MSTPTSAPASTRAPRALLPALIAVLLLIAAACGADAGAPGAGPGEAQPGVGGQLVSASLADVPVPTAADPTGGLVEEEGRQTQAYVVTASSPGTLQDFYGDELPPLGWRLQNRDQLNEGITSTWTDGERMLLIATESDGVDATLSLQVADLGADVPGVDDDS